MAPGMPASSRRWRHGGPITSRPMGLVPISAQMTAAGDYPRIVLGIAVMSALVVFVNRLLWRPLYAYGERHFRLD